MALIDDQISTLEKAVVSPATPANMLPQMKQALYDLKAQRYYNPPAATTLPPVNPANIVANKTATATPVVAPVVTPAAPIVEQAVEVIEPLTDGFLSKIREKVPAWAVYSGLGVVALAGLMVVRKILK